MADQLTNKNGNGKKPSAMGIGIIVSVCVAMVGWILLAQSWAKDTSHVVLQQQIDMNGKRLSGVEITQDKVVDEIMDLKENQARILANQEAMTKVLERLERKIP